MYKKVVCFDLDDTLYKEIDYVASGYRTVASFIGQPELESLMMQWHLFGLNTFEELNRHIHADKPIGEYLGIYREHIPEIALSDGISETLDALAAQRVVLGLITDGRSMSQRNKIKALGLEKWFNTSDIIISEEFGTDKTDERNFRYFMDAYLGCEYYYVGDNPAKDFFVPNRLGWQTVMLKDDGRNIYKQDFNQEEASLPQKNIHSFSELMKLI